MSTSAASTNTSAANLAASSSPAQSGSTTELTDTVKKATGNMGAVSASAQVPSGTTASMKETSPAPMKTTVVQVGGITGNALTSNQAASFSGMRQLPQQNGATTDTAPQSQPKTQPDSALGQETAKSLKTVSFSAEGAQPEADATEGDTASLDASAKLEGESRALPAGDEAEPKAAEGDTASLDASAKLVGESRALPAGDEADSKTQDKSKTPLEKFKQAGKQVIQENRDKKAAQSTPEQLVSEAVEAFQSEGKKGESRKKATMKNALRNLDAMSKDKSLSLFSSSTQTQIDKLSKSLTSAQRKTSVKGLLPIAKDAAKLANALMQKKEALAENKSEFKQAADYFKDAASQEGVSTADKASFAKYQIMAELLSADGGDIDQAIAKIDLQIAALSEISLDTADAIKTKTEEKLDKAIQAFQKTMGSTKSTSNAASAMKKLDNALAKAEQRIGQAITLATATPGDSEKDGAATKKGAVLASLQSLRTTTGDDDATIPGTLKTKVEDAKTDGRQAFVGNKQTRWANKNNQLNASVERAVQNEDSATQAKASRKDQLEKISQYEKIKGQSPIDIKLDTLNSQRAFLRGEMTQDQYTAKIDSEIDQLNGMKDIPKNTRCEKAKIVFASAGAHLYSAFSRSSETATSNQANYAAGKQSKLDKMEAKGLLLPGMRETITSRLNGLSDAARPVGNNDLDADKAEREADVQARIDEFKAAKNGDIPKYKPEEMQIVPYVGKGEPAPTTLENLVDQEKQALERSALDAIMRGEEFPSATALPARGNTPEEAEAAQAVAQRDLAAVLANLPTGTGQVSAVKVDELD